MLIWSNQKLITPARVIRLIFLALLLTIVGVVVRQERGITKSLANHPLYIPEASADGPDTSQQQPDGGESCESSC